MNQVATRMDTPVAPAVATETTSMLAAIQRMAENPSLDLDRFERLLQMQERLQEREAKRLFDEAMSGMQPDLPIIGERGTSNNATYAKWSDISEAIKPILSQHGFSLTHRSRQVDGRIEVTAIVSHRSGHREETTIASAPDKGPGRNDIQAIGSALSYLQRYTAKLLLNLTSRLDGDDDGRASSGEPPKPTITPEQVEQIRKALAFREVPEERALKKFKVDALEEIYAIDFEPCLKIAQNAGAKA